ncbi:MAG: helix-hairpin-helix domain-containing protein [Nitrospirae bacterium]|nr:helix-hairpin-helix domain-containing protein [Nitrospirota bacterium]
MKRGLVTISWLLLLLSISSTLPCLRGVEAAESSYKTAPWVININTASAEEIVAVPGLGEKKSQAIVMFREKHGPFAKIEDIKKVDGIGDKLFERIMAYLVVKGDTTWKSSKK